MNPTSIYIHIYFLSSFSPHDTNLFTTHFHILSYHYTTPHFSSSLSFPPAKPPLISINRQTSYFRICYLRILINARQGRKYSQYSHQPPTTNHQKESRYISREEKERRLVAWGLGDGFLFFLINQPKRSGRDFFILRFVVLRFLVLVLVLIFEF